MLNRLHAFADSILHDTSFSCVYRKGEPAIPEKIRKLEDALQRTGVPAPKSLLTFYRDCDGLTFRWSHKEVTHPDYLAGGDVEFDSIDLLTSRLYPPDPVLLDRVSETNQTLFQLEPEIRLLYYDESTGRDFPLPFDLDKYFRLLDLSRALHPWRELAANAPALSVEPVRREHFAASARRLFGEQDSSELLAEIGGKV
jgi:hypothetical protein